MSVASILPKDKVKSSSAFGLEPASFDIQNDNSPTHSNLCIDASTPRGVLGGMVATLSTATVGGVAVGWQAAECDYDEFPIGLFANNSEGAAFENSPALASGIVPIYQFGGNFLVYYFETHEDETNSAYDLSVAYGIGTLLYPSLYHLLIPKAPTTNGTPASADYPVAVVAKPPTSTDLELGICLLK